jgi:hypothetical protein
MTKRLWHMTDRGTFATSYRVTRKTPGRVFFQTLGGERYVSRRPLERDGFTRSRVLGALLFSDDGYRRFLARAAPRDPSLAALGLTSSASPDDVKRAFRERAKVAHPDAGGSSEAFIALRTSYERALEVVRDARGST